MAKVLSAQQVRFCELYASGRPAGRAYEEAGYSARGTSANSAGSKLLTNDNVQKRIKELKKEASKECRWIKRDALNFLADVLETPIGSVYQSHNLAQEYQEATERSGARIKMPSKMDALDKMARLCGWYEAEKHDVQMNDLRQIIASARAKDTR